MDCMRSNVISALAEIEIEQSMSIATENYIQQIVHLQKEKFELLKDTTFGFTLKSYGEGSTGEGLEVENVVDGGPACEKLK